MEEIINVLIKKGKGNSSIKKFAKKNLPEYLIELEEKDICFNCGGKAK